MTKHVVHYSTGRKQELFGSSDKGAYAHAAWVAAQTSEHFVIERKTEA